MTSQTRTSDTSHATILNPHLLLLSVPLHHISSLFALPPLFFLDQNDITSHLALTTTSNAPTPSPSLNNRPSNQSTPTMPIHVLHHRMSASVLRKEIDAHLLCHSLRSSVVGIERESVSDERLPPFSSKDNLTLMSATSCDLPIRLTGESKSSEAGLESRTRSMEISCRRRERVREI